MFNLSEENKQKLAKVAIDKIEFDKEQERTKEARLLASSKLLSENIEELQFQVERQIIEFGSFSLDPFACAVLTRKLSNEELKLIRIEDGYIHIDNKKKLEQKSQGGIIREIYSKIDYELQYQFKEDLRNYLRLNGYKKEGSLYSRGSFVRAGEKQSEALSDSSNYDKFAKIGFIFFIIILLIISILSFNC